MKEDNIRKYAELMKELSLTGMEITEDGTTVRLERMPVPEAVRTVSVAAEPVAEAPKAQPQSGAAVTSPMVGIFYAAPAENAEPYVKAGDSVTVGIYVHCQGAGAWGKIDDVLLNSQNK